MDTWIHFVAVVEECSSSEDIVCEAHVVPAVIEVARSRVA